ncbi:hypothetical protein D8674_017938 [Pyrus ussuriensis x Pyrus communis]|uniref:Aminotransferase-like plant mobile domain-containing protein n=1 Tax=Pyrus ussuriensis x Pyrus communis TaxID=2448454 RepID=A0A5N5HF76_9ROSA|nr:hypothetical protein D8674_017938 [Pyrus ussuriensis x Pyrus communis]
MENGIYKLIMMSKVTVIAKPKLLTIALLFWNNGTNTFDFRMGPMTPTVLDMAQVFGLRPSGRRYPWFSDQIFKDAFGEDANSLSGIQAGNPSALFFYFMQCGTSYRLRSHSKVTFRTTWRSMEVMCKIAHKLVALNFEVLKQRGLPSPSLLPLQPALTGCYIPASLVERAPIPSSSSSNASAMVVVPTFQFNPTTGEMLHFVEDDSAPSSLVHEATPQPTTAFEEPVALEIPIVSEVTTSVLVSSKVAASTEASGKGSGKAPQPAVFKVVIPWLLKASKVTRMPVPRPRNTPMTEAPPTISFEAASTTVASGGAGVMPPPLASIPATTFLPELVREFRQIKTKLRTLRDQYLKAKRQHSKTSTSLQQLVEEGSAMEDRIMVVDAEIQKLEEQLSALKNIEEVKRVNLEVEDVEAQLANSNIALEELGQIFTIMQTYHSRIAALAKDVSLIK